jgi:hypothetical protein
MKAVLTETIMVDMDERIIIGQPKFVGFYDRLDNFDRTFYRSQMHKPLNTSWYSLEISGAVPLKQVQRTRKDVLLCFIENDRSHHGESQLLSSLPVLCWIHVLITFSLSNSYLNSFLQLGFEVRYR